MRYYKNIQLCRRKNKNYEKQTILGGIVDYFAVYCYNIRMKLRDYQKQCVNIIDGLEKGAYLVSMATGLGKTVIFSALKRHGRVLIISHREELVYQPIKYYDCRCGVEKAEVTSHGEEVVSASVQTLIRRLDKFRPDDFDTIITDEAHHAAAKSYKKIYSYFKPRLSLGFTATPNRGDKVRLDDVFERIIFERDLKWGILNGYLTNIRCMRAKVSWNLNRVKTSMGDFQTASLESAINSDYFNDEVAKVYSAYARGQTLIFASSVSHAENIAAKIPGAVAVSQKTKNRAGIIRDFTARKIPCIVNCMVFTEGTDMPLIETIIIARPTKNQSLYTQMVGRGLRPYEGKEFLTLIDLVGVTDSLDICTAPSLLGIDMASVPKSKIGLIEGMLTDMPAIVDNAADCPENWVINVKAVKLFEKDQRVDAYNINWTKKPNGDLVYQFACGDRIGIKAINEVGRTKVMYYTFSEEEDRFKYSEGNEGTLQDALTEAYGYFLAAHDEERALWNLDNYFVWQNEPATEKQIAYVKNKLSKEDYLAVINGNHTRKGDFSQIINMLKIKNATMRDLRAMHSRAKQKEQENRQKKEELKKLKIETIFVTAVRDKYYAIKHPSRLVITDNWQCAADLISQLDGRDGEKCHFKKFPSKSQAIDYLRS